MKTLITILILTSLVYGDCKEKLIGDENIKPIEAKGSTNIKDILQKNILDKRGLKVEFSDNDEWNEENFKLQQHYSYKDAFESIIRKYGLSATCIDENTISISKPKIESGRKVSIIQLDYNLSHSEFNQFIDLYKLEEKFNIERNKTLSLNQDLSFIFVDIENKLLSEFKEIITSYIEAKKKSKGIGVVIDDTPIESKLIRLNSMTIENFMEFNKSYIHNKITPIKISLDENLNSVYVETTSRKLIRLEKLLADYEELVKSKKNGTIGVDNSEMNITVIPLKYINATGIDMGKEESSQIEDLEITLSNLMGTKIIKSDNNLTLKSTDSYIKLDKRTNSIIVKDYPAKIRELQKIVKEIDKRVDLIDIEVLILSGNDNFRRGLGLRVGGSRDYTLEHPTKGIQKIEQFGVSTSSSIANGVNEASIIPTTEVTSYDKDIKSDSNKDGDYALKTENSALSGEKAMIEKANVIDLLNPLNSLGLSSSFFFIADKKSFQVQIDAFEDSGDAKILSNPHIVTLDHRKAKILSGKSVSVPIVTEERMSREEVESGISIDVEPHIIKDKNESNPSDIMLNIKVEKSSLGSASTENIEKTQNSIETYVIIKNNQTLVLGGLFDYFETKSVGGIPLLKDIPLFGKLFSTENISQDKSELLFFITPRIVEQQDFNTTKSEKYLKFKDKKYNRYSKELDNLTGRISKDDVNTTIFDKEDNTTKKEDVNLTVHEKRLNAISIEHNNYGGE